MKYICIYIIIRKKYAVYIAKYCYNMTLLSLVRNKLSNCKYN